MRKHKKYHLSQQGFTLIELAIVVVIIGLLTGGILVSQNLIRSAELKNITARLDYYSRSVLEFRTKYLALPGDIGNAENLWGAEPVANCPGDASTPSTGVATCNGNENTQINVAPGAGFGNEVFRMWQHLGNADFIDGSFTGVQGALGAGHVVAHQNAPGLRVDNAAISVQFLGTTSADDFAGDLGNVFFIGRPNNTNGVIDMPILRPEEALNIDDKRDDGAPGTGRLRSRNATKHPGCASSDNGNSAAYLATNTSITCQLIYVPGY